MNKLIQAEIRVAFIRLSRPSKLTISRVDVNFISRCIELITKQEGKGLYADLNIKIIHRKDDVYRYFI